MKHNVFIIVLTLLLMLSLCSCHSDQPAGCVTTDGNGTTVIPSETTKSSDDSGDSVPENALKVRSVYSSKNYLIPGEFDRAYYNSLLYVDSEYYGLYTYTSVINDNLCITNYPYSTSSKIERIFVKWGVFVGTASHYDGKVIYFESVNDPSSEKLIADECLSSFIKVSNENVYIITGSPSDPGKSKDEGYNIYHAFIDAGTQKWTWSKEAHLPELPQQATLSNDGKIIYIACMKNIYAYDILTGTLLALSMPDYWAETIKISITEHNGKLYVGSRGGISELDLNTKQCLWYPVYYDELSEK